MITSTSEDSGQKVLKISLKKTLVVSCNISKVYERNRVENIEFRVISVEVKTLKIKTHQNQGSCCAQMDLWLPYHKMLPSWNCVLDVPGLVHRTGAVAVIADYHVDCYFARLI